MDLISRATEFEQTRLQSLSTSDRVKISRQAKELVLSLNELYKVNHDVSIMDQMKRITAIKKRVEKRLLKVPIV